MEPITQANLDPKLNDIRHMRAEQSLDGVIRCQSSLNTSIFRNIKQVVRIQHSPLAWIGAGRGNANLQ